MRNVFTLSSVCIVKQSSIQTETPRVTLSEKAAKTMTNLGRVFDPARSTSYWW